VRDALGDDGASRTDLIRAAARKHFADHGYEATTMRDIARDAGINIATLYFHCSTKEQLLFDVLMYGMERLIHGVNEVLATAPNTWSGRLGTALGYHVRVCARGDFGGVSVTTTEFRALTGEFRQRLIAARDEYEGLFRSLIVGGIEAGEFLPVDVPTLVAGLIGFGWSVARWFQPGGRLTAEQVADEYVQFTLRGLRTAHADPQESDAD
jgi:AcrR family transcriptional regulator